MCWGCTSTSGYAGRSEASISPATLSALLLAVGEQPRLVGAPPGADLDGDDRRAGLRPRAHHRQGGGRGRVVLARTRDRLEVRPPIRPDAPDHLGMLRRTDRQM